MTLAELLNCWIPLLGDALAFILLSSFASSFPSLPLSLSLSEVLLFLSAGALLREPLISQSDVSASSFSSFAFSIFDVILTLHLNLQCPYLSSLYRYLGFPPSDFYFFKKNKKQKRKTKRAAKEVLRKNQKTPLVISLGFVF